MDHSVLMIASIFAVLKVGAAYVPVEPDFPEDRIRYIMEQCKVTCIVTQTHYANLFQDIPLVFAKKCSLCAGF